MIFEFAGLPGSGKSTIAAEASRILKSRGARTESLRSHARRAMVDSRTSVRFLKGNAERCSLFGALSYSDAHPATSCALIEAPGATLAQRLWASEMMAQLWFSGQSGHSGKAILVDEGLVHRGISAYSSGESTLGFHAFLDGLDFHHALVVVACDPEVAIARSQQRPRGLPKPFVGPDGAPDLRKLMDFHGLIVTSADTLSRRGASVLRIDASDPVEVSGAALAEWIIARLQTER